MNTIFGYYVDNNEQICSPIFFEKKEACKYKLENYGNNCSFEVYEVEIDAESLQRYLVQRSCRGSSTTTNLKDAWQHLIWL